MAAKLLYRDAQGRDASVDLPTDGAFLGRAVDCIVRTDDAMVSRKNCKVAFLGGRWYVEDLGSANGTFVNERRIQKEMINHGDVVRCGSLQVRFIEVAVQDPLAAQGQGAQPSQPSSQASQASKGVPQAINSGAQTGHHPISKLDEPIEPPPIQGDRQTKAEAAAVVSTAGRTEEVKKAEAAAAEAKQQLEVATQKLDAAEQEAKRLRSDLGALKDASEKVRRQAKQNEDELLAQQKLNEDFRREVKQLRADLDKLKTTAEDLRTQNESKDRQISTLNDDVRRGKQQADNLNAKLVEATRAKDEQIRSMNDKSGEADHLREVIRERERMLEEKRVGLINLEAQFKDLRTRTDALDKELAQTRGERDNLRDRQAKNQVQIEDLRVEIDRLNNAIAGQQAGGEQLAHLSRENTDLREELRRLQDENDKAQAFIEKSKADITQIEKLRAAAAEYAEYKAGERQRLQQATDQAVGQAVGQATKQLTETITSQVRGQLEAGFQAERQKLAAERDAALRARDDAQTAAQAAEHTLNTPLDDSALRAAVAERDTLRGKIAELEKQLSSASAGAAAGSHPDAERMLAEIKGLAGTAYEGINDALSELRLSIVLAQETYDKLERSIADKNAAKTVRDAIDQTMDKADEAKGHIRSLRSILD